MENITDLIKFEVESEELDFRLSEFACEIYTDEDFLKAYVLLTKTVDAKALATLIREIGISGDYKLKELSENKYQQKAIRKKSAILISDISERTQPSFDITFDLPQKKEISKYLDLLVVTTGKVSADQNLPLINVMGETLVAKRKNREEVAKVASFINVLGESKTRKVFFFELGNGLNENEDGEIFSTYSGQFEISREKIWIKEKFVISSISDWTGGKLRFVATVEIAEGVIEHFDIEAGNDILIMGSSETSNLRAGNQVVIKDGIIGQGVAHIQAKSLIKSKYVNQAELFCAKEIDVSRGCFHSKVFAHSKLLVEKGPIVGGFVYGATGVEARVLGGVSGVKTVVVAGFCSEVPLSLDAVVGEMNEIKPKLQSITEKMRLISANPEFVEKLSDKEKQNIIALKNEMMKMKKRLQELSIWLVDHDLDACQNARITVRGSIYPGTIIKINNLVLEIKQEFRKTIFKADMEAREIVMTPMGR